jgi:hypothetical protein
VELSDDLASRCAGLLELQGTDGWGDLKVQFLHKSVAEFLERPDIQAELLQATSGSNFDAGIFLLSFSILELKFLEPKTTRHRRDYAVEQAITIAREFEPRSREKLTDLLDELELVMVKACAKLSPSVSEHWAHVIRLQCSVPPSSPGLCELFLSLCTAHGLFLYLQEKVRRALINLRRGMTLSKQSKSSKSTASVTAQRLEDNTLSSSRSQSLNHQQLPKYRFIEQERQNWRDVTGLLHRDNLPGTLL